MQAGDLILVRTSGFLARIIRLGEWLHRRGRSCRWNHAAVAVSPTEVVEATGRGVARRPLRYTDFHVVPSRMSGEDRGQVVTFATSCVGVRYGYVTILSIALDLLTPAFWSFRSSRTLICSELAARAWEHGGHVWPELDCARIMPSDLAFWTAR